MFEIISIQTYILALETIILLMADKKRALLYFALALFSVFVFFYI